MEAERFDLIGELAAGFPSVVIAEQTIEVYANDLADLPLDVLRSAIAVCRSESRFFPTVVEIRERANALTVSDSKPPIDCPRCFGTGWEQYRESGYINSRRCDHVISDEEDLSMF